MELYKCHLCGRMWIPSIYIYKKDDKSIELGTRCANKLRFDGKHTVENNIIRDKYTKNECGVL